MFSGMLPVLVRVTVCCALVIFCGVSRNPTAFGVTSAVVTLVTPLPVRGIWWGLVADESVMVSVPVRVPVAVGVKVKVTGQLPFGGSAV